ncbi:MAG: alpha/beta fold hydrolase [Sphingomonadales bacterium]|nr:alpha/beta fold hydrolase [Sphingomonadales bacterium]
MMDFVLVHGGGHGGWCWARLAPLLEAAGHRVWAPTLTGLAERAGELSADTGLDTHIDDVVRVIEGEDLRGVVLVGHSYGGMVVTGVADRVPDRLAWLTFLDAPQPRDGESLAGISPGLAERIGGDEPVCGVPVALTPSVAQCAMFGLTAPADVAWAMAHLTPHPVKAFTDALRLRDEAAMLAVPRATIDCTALLANRPAGLQARARECARQWQVDAPHDLMITHPAEVAACLLALAAA